MFIKKYTIRSPVDIDDTTNDLYWYPSFINGQLDDWFVGIQDTTPTFYSRVAAIECMQNLKKTNPKLKLELTTI